MSEGLSCGRLLFVLAIAGVAAGCGTSSSISLNLSPSAPQVIDQGQTLTVKAAVTNDSSGKGVLWSLAGPGSLSNSTGLTVTYSGPTGNLASPQAATVTATSGADQTKKASVQITVNPPPQIPTQTLANGSVGTSYSQTITLTGGTAPFAWSVYSGSIVTGSSLGGAVPDGLTLNQTTGTINGTPTAGGTWYFEATSTDAAGVVAINGFLSIQINSKPQPANPFPFLNQPLAPTAVSPGTHAFVLKVSGTGFVRGATVNFNRSALATTFVDSEHLSAVVPASDAASAGTASVTVTNPAPGGGRSNAVTFEVGAPEETVTFVNAANSPLQFKEPFGLTVSDFNEDGKPDLAVAANTNVYVMLGSGDGTFQPASGSPLQVLNPPFNSFASPFAGPLAAGDFNNSGHLGLAVSVFQNGAAAIFLGKGDGSFTPSSAMFAAALGAPESDVETADFNGDGNLDLAITNEYTGGSPVDLGYGKGAFTPTGVLYTQIFPVGVAVGDFNADGKLDAIVASAGTKKYPDSGFAISLGNGDGTFRSAAGSPISLGNSLSAIVAGDFNGDGKLDLAVTDSDLNEAMILLGNGNGSFRVAATIPTGNQPWAITTGDFNNDGKLDLAIANYGDGTVTLLLGRGDGTFRPADGSPYTVGQNPFAIRAADFNGDGKLDLAVANLGTVSILLQQ